MIALNSNTWNDRCWGVRPVGIVGLNMLGVLLMEIRQNWRRDSK